MPARSPDLRPLLLLAAAMLLAGGCSRAVKTPVANPFEIDAREFDRVFSASVLELQDQGFIVDRQDHRFGRVTTRPLVSPTFIEFWRDTNTTALQSATSTLNNQRRLVTVRIEPASPAPAATSPATVPASAPASAKAAPPASAPAPTLLVGGYQLGVEVHVEQLQIPSRRLSGSTRGPSIINTLAAVPAEMSERGIPPGYWRPVGRDPFLEQRLLAAIVRRSVLVSPGQERSPLVSPAPAAAPAPATAPASPLASGAQPRG